MSVIGIDIGYRYTKIFTVEGGKPRSLVFPTAVCKYVLEFYFGEKIPTVGVNSEKFAIGEELIRHGIQAENTIRDDFVGSPSYFAVMGYALEQVNSSLQIAVLGLPPTLYNREKVKEVIDKTQSVQIVGSKGTRVTIPRVIKIVPQGAGIFFNFVSNHGELFYQNIVVLDIGYHTLDIVFFSMGKYIENSARSYPMGVREIYKEIERLFSSTYGTFPKGEESLERLIRYGKFTHFGKEYTLDTKEIIDSYRSKVMSYLKGFARDVNMPVDLVLAGGGGVSLLGSLQPVITVSNPQQSNARGFYEYGKQFLGS